MVKHKINEATLLLERLDSRYVGVLMEICRNPKIKEPLLELIDIIKNLDAKSIINIAGSAESMDGLVKVNKDQAFKRGRISLGVLIRYLILESEKEAEKREKKSNG